MGFDIEVETGKQERRGENINITTVQYAQCYSYPSDISIFSAQPKDEEGSSSVLSSSEGICQDDITFNLYIKHQ